MSDDLILSAKRWPTNAHMIADVFSLHVKPKATVIDATYGKGNFWTVHRPVNLIAHDIDSKKGDGVDFRDLPEADRSIDVLVLDPEYVARGGRKTSTIPDMVAAYGMDYSPATPEALWVDIETGIEEAARVLKHKGLIMLKLMNYISSGQVVNVLRWAFDAFDANHFEVHDWFVNVGDPGPQPKHDKCRHCIAGNVEAWIGDMLTSVRCEHCVGLGTKERPQVHSRNNASHLLVGRLKLPKAMR